MEGTAMTNENKSAIETLKALRDSMPRNAKGDRAAVILGSAILHLMKGDC
jgi:hypothetical protein